MAVIMLGVGLYLLRVQVNSTGENVVNNQSTYETLATIRNALVAYKGVNGALPCPAGRAYVPSSTNYGVALCGGPFNATTGITSNAGAYFGAVPFRTLSIKEANSYDAWGNKILYAVISVLTSAGTYTVSPAASFTVNQPTGSATTTQTVILLSHGRTAEGAYGVGGTTAIITCGSSTNADVENCNNDLTFYDGIQTSVIGSTFYDDVMQYYSPF